MRLVLFDVDGTLISAGGAGMRAFYRALRSVFDIEASRELIRPDGKTDPLILKELMACLDLADRWSDRTQEAVFSSYLGFLEDEMCRAKEQGLVGILPGALELLEMLSGQSDFCIGLATGNLERGAYIKLDKAGLNGYFRFGGYGSDSEDRTTLTRIGIRRGAQVIAPEPVEGVFVVGDTPLDILHGHAVGASVIAVSSAGYSPSDLSLHGPDLLVPDLTAGESIVRFMRMKP
jgi:phosphoglycolate phosphatase-like HAD superfamily hydrolase